MNMDEQYRKRVDERAKEMIRSGEFDHLVIPDRGARLGRNSQDDMSLSYFIRDIPTFDGNGILYHNHMFWNLVISLMTLDQKLEIYLKNHRQMIENIIWQ